jgi:hypothetical protein
MRQSMGVLWLPVCSQRKVVFSAPDQRQQHLVLWKMLLEISATFDPRQARV